MAFDNDDLIDAQREALRWKHRAEQAEHERDEARAKVAAAREEGRRDGIGHLEALTDFVPVGSDGGVQMMDWSEADCREALRHIRFYLIRALASQPKAEPAATCEGCRRGWPIRRAANESPYHDSLGLLTPCTAADAGKAGT